MNRYYCLYRPPCPGAIPRGMTKIVAFDDKRHVDEIGRDAWGYVEYDKPLTAQQVIHYELAVAQTDGECGNEDDCEF